MKLRDYQQACINRLQQVTEGNVCVQMPTGAGKTVVMATHIVQSNLPTLVVAHRRELIEQIRNTIVKIDPLATPIIMSSKNKDEVVSQRPPLIILTTIQTLTKGDYDYVYRKVKGGLVVVDEAHRVGAPSYERLLTACPWARTIGYTATPIRSDGTPLGMAFDELILGKDIGADYDTLLENNNLVPYSKVFTTSRPVNFAHIPVSAGDYQSGKSGAFLSQAKHVGDVVNTWKRVAENRPTLAFCCTVNHCQVIADEFRSKGVPVEVIIGTTNPDIRDTHVARLKHRDIKVIITCLVYTEGVDIPEVSCIIVDRPTRLLGLFLQMVGRGTRPSSGKSDCILIDHCGLTHTFGRPLTDDVDWSLNGRPVLHERKPKVCVSCGFLLDRNRYYSLLAKGISYVCPNCYTQQPIPKQRTRGYLEREQEELVLFSGKPLNPMGYEWRDDIQDAKYKYLKSLFKGTKFPQHRAELRDFIVRKCVDGYKRRFFRMPPINWFMPETHSMTKEELYTTCLTVMSIMCKFQPEDHYNEVKLHAQSLYSTERKEEDRPKFLDIVGVESAYYKSLMPDDIQAYF